MIGKETIKSKTIDLQILKWIRLKMFTNRSGELKERDKEDVQTCQRNYIMDYCEDSTNGAWDKENSVYIPVKNLTKYLVRDKQVNYPK